jgi:hypothetical protein
MGEPTQVIDIAPSRAERHAKGVRVEIKLSELNNIRQRDQNAFVIAKLTHAAKRAGF